MIRLDRVSKKYQTSAGDVRALDDLTLEIQKGEFAAVCGHSGCGKLTLLSLVGGLTTPTSGKVVVAGEAVSELSAGDRAAFRARHVGFVFQMFHLLPYLSVCENILLSARAGSMAEDRAYADQLIEQFGLQSRRTHRPGQLSAGERQRTAMARALLTRPQLLLADEPTGNLDPHNAETLLDLIADFHEHGGTVLLVTHDEKAAARAQRTVELEAGKLRHEETIKPAIG